MQEELRYYLALDYQIHETVADENGNFIIHDITILYQRLPLLTLYGHNNDNPGFFFKISLLI